MLNRNPNSFELAMKAKQKGDLRQAIDLFKQCPVSFETLFQIGKCYHGIEHYGEALKSFNAAREETKKDFKDVLKIHEQISDTYLLYYAKTQDEKLLQGFKSAIDNHPVQTCNLVQYFMAVYYFYCDQIPKVKNIIQKLKQENIHDADLMVRVLNFEYKVCRSIGVEFSEDNARELVKYVQMSNLPNASIFHDLIKNYPQLISIIKQKINPGHSLQEQVSMAELQIIIDRKFDEEFYQKLLKRFPDSWIVHRNYAHHLENNGDTRGAIDVFEPYVCSKFSYQLDNQKLLNSYRFLASCYLRLNNTIKAKEYIHLGLQINARDASLHSMLAKINPEHSITSYRNFAIAGQDKKRAERLHPGYKPQESKVAIESGEKSSSMISNKASETISTAKPQIGYKLAENQKDVEFTRKKRQSKAKNTKAEVDLTLLENPFEFDIGSSNNVIEPAKSEAVTKTTTQVARKGETRQQQHKKLPKKNLNKTAEKIVVNEDNSLFDNKAPTVEFNQAENQTSFCQKFGLFAAGVIITTASVYIASTQFKPNG